MNFTIEELIDLTETWITKGDLDCSMLADNFQFISPYWKSNSRAEFIEKFKHSSDYKESILSNIIKFDPISKFKSLDGKQFSIILQYHTKNGCSIYETILGTAVNGMLVELRTIYDLDATKKAHLTANPVADIAYCIEYFYPKPGCREQLVSALLELRPMAHAEPGCLQYDLLQDHEDSDLIILIVKFANQELMKRHENQDYVKQFAENEMEQYCEKLVWKEGLGIEK